MGEKPFTVGDLPPNFMDETGRALADYSVALGYSNDTKARRFNPIGSGVLVRKGNHFGILTARHCLHNRYFEVRLGPSGSDTLFLVLQRGRGLVLEPHDVIEHPLVEPTSEEFGPDLVFIEFLPKCLGSVKAIGSFWSMDRDLAQLKSDFGIVGTPLAAIGFPGVHYDTSIEGCTIHHSIRHMAYYFAIGPNAVFEREGWDYIDNNCWYGGSSELPASFEGMSGGPVWGLQLKLNEADGSFRLIGSALIGITFYETGVQNEDRQLRAHFIKSIYDLAWRNLN